MLILDFDGVLMNSIDEITVTAYNMVTKKLVFTLQDLPENVAVRFQQNRFHVQPIGDVVPLMRWAMENDHLAPDYILPREAYPGILRSETTPLCERIDLFFETRRMFIQTDADAWLRLNSPFPAVWDELMKHPPRRVVMLTNKNRAPALRLCHHFSLMVPEENIYSGDAGVTKIDNLNRIHERFDDAPYEFIDDSLKNLRDLDRHFNGSGPFLRLILAVWGYVGPEDAKQASALGYSVFTQQELVDLLIKRLPCSPQKTHLTSMPDSDYLRTL